MGAATVRPSARSAAANALSAAAYSAQTLAAQYAWHRPRWKRKQPPQDLHAIALLYQTDMHGTGSPEANIFPHSGTCSEKPLPGIHVMQVK